MPLPLFFMLVACRNANPLQSDLHTVQETAKTEISIAATNDNLTPLMISEFESNHPGIHLKRVEPNPYLLLNPNSIADVPDIISISLEDFPYYAQQGAALNLGPYVKDNAAFDSEALFPIVNFFRYNGSQHGSGDLYGFLKGWSPGSVLLYHKSLFDAADLPYPEREQPMTWDELLEISRSLTIKHEEKHDQYGFGVLDENSIMNQNMYLLQMAQLGKTPWYSNYNKADFTSDESKRIFQYWNQVLQYEIGPDPMNLVTNSSKELFLEGKLAILMADYGFAMQVEQSALDPRDIGFAPLPLYENGKHVLPFQSKSAAIIYSKTEHPDAAWKVFEWYLTGQPAREWVTMHNEFPVSKAEASDLYASSAWSRQVLNFFQQQINMVQPFPDFNPYVTNRVMNNLFDKYLIPVYFHKVELQTAMYKLSQDVYFEIQDHIQMAE